MRDTAEIEKRANDAGIKLLKTEEKIENVEKEFGELRQARMHQQEILQEIQEVRSALKKRKKNGNDLFMCSQMSWTNVLKMFKGYFL